MFFQQLHDFYANANLVIFTLFCKLINTYRQGTKTVTSPKLGTM